MGFFSFKKTFWVNSRFSQTPDLVSMEESVVTQVANSSSGYHQCDLPALGKKGPSWGQTGQSGEGARLDVDSSFGLRFIRKVAVFMSLNFSDLTFPTGKRMDSPHASFTQGCHKITCTRKGFYTARQKGFIKYKVI